MLFPKKGDGIDETLNEFREQTGGLLWNAIERKLESLGGEVWLTEMSGRRGIKIRRLDWNVAKVHLTYEELLKPNDYDPWASDEHLHPQVSKEKSSNLKSGAL